MIRRVNVNGNGVAVLSRAIGLGGGGATSATNQRFLQAALYGTTAYSNANSNPHWLSSRGLADRFGPIAPSSVPNGVVGTRFINSLAKEPPRAEKFSPKDVVLFQYEACPFCNKVKGIRLPLCRFPRIFDFLIFFPTLFFIVIILLFFQRSWIITKFRTK